MLNSSAGKQIERRSFNNLTSWFTLPTFIKGNPTQQEEHQYVISHFGNKTFNLCVLNALAQKINATLGASSANRMAVPQFWGISHQELSEYLNKTMQLDTLWKQFVAQQAANKDLDAQAAQTLDTIRQSIIKAFSDVKIIPAPIKQQIESFIAHHKTSLFMVRSTGDEDRTDIANAGGNESVASVQPDLQAIWDAMGMVVQSYFSEKSLRQRMLAGDNITKRYFIPVLIQRMIGEKVWTGKNPGTLLEIPISGVMFTQESAGNTPGVVQIQTAYGHNQGVVNSLVAVDTFYSGPSGVIHPIIRKKIDRLVSIKSNTGLSLERVSNPSSLQSRPTLSAGLAHDLSRIAQEIGIIYNYPMDIEFVVEQKQQGATIYLVQARPLIERTFAQAPDYLTDEFIALMPAQQFVKGQTIGIAGGFIRNVTSKDEIIIRDELPQALNEYHDNPERSTIKAVIVTKMAPSTSHEATQFRGYAAPVLVIAPEDKTKLEQLINQGAVVIDTQRALIAVSSAQEKAPAATTSSAAHEKRTAAQTASGWYTHPIAQQTSIIANYMLPQGTQLHKKYPQYIKELAWKKGDPDNLKQSHRELLDLIKKSGDNRSVLIDTLKRIINRISMLLQVKAIKSLAAQKKEQSDTAAASEYLELFMHAGGKEEQTVLDETKLVLANAILCATEILYTFDATADAKMPATSKRIAYLYPIKFLEATILQQADPEIVANYSYLQMRKMLQEDLRAIAALSPALPKTVQDLKQTLGVTTFEYVVQLEKLEPLTLNQDIGNAWHTFMQQLTKQASSGDAKMREEHGKLIGQFATTVAQLNDLQVLDLWINTSFITQANKEKDAIKLCKTLIAQVEGTDQKEAKEGTLPNKELIALFNQKKSILNSWANKIDAWGDPAQFPALYKQFDDQFVSEFIAGKDSASKKMYDGLMYKGTDIAPLNYELLIQFATQHAPMIKLFNNASALGKLVLLQLFKQIIDTYDRTIKGMTGSPAYKDKMAQVQNFAKLLVPYVALMEQMTMLVRDQEKELMQTDLLENKDWNWPFKKYLPFIHNILKNNIAQLNISLLNASQGFIVSSAQIGSKVDYDRAQPQTLEDIFTLAHQNMLIILSSLNTKYGINKGLLPEILQKICNSLEQVEVENFMPANLIGIDYQFPHLNVYYNIPLRQHSSTFEIKYNSLKNPNQAILVCKFLGHNEENRMNALVAYAYAASLASNLQFASDPFSTACTKLLDFKKSHITEFSWIIDTKTDLKKITEYLSKFCNFTFSAYFDNPSSHSGLLVMLHQFNLIQESDFKSLYYQLESLSKEKRKKILAQLSFLEKLAKKEPIFSSWLIAQLIKTEEYDKAIALIKNTADKIIKENKFFYSIEKTVRESDGRYNNIVIPVLYELLNNLTQILKKTGLQSNAWLVAENILSSKKALLEVFKHKNFNYQEASPYIIKSVIDLYMQMLTYKQSPNAYATVQELITEPQVVKTFITNLEISLDELLSIVEKIQGKKIADELYEKFIKQILELFEKSLMSAKKLEAYKKNSSNDLFYGIIKPLIKYIRLNGKKYPALYAHADYFAQKLLEEYKENEQRPSLVSSLIEVIELLQDAGKEKPFIEKAMKEKPFIFGLLKSNKFIHNY